VVVIGILDPSPLGDEKMNSHESMTVRVLVWLAFVALAATESRVADAADPPATFTALAQKSRFIFVGTVTRVKAASMPGVPVSDHTVVVRIDQTLRSGKTLDDFTGKEITVYLATPGSAAVRQTFAFFTNGWLYGNGLAVQEVGRLEAKDGRIDQLGSAADARKLLADLDAQDADSALKSRMARAHLIVTGKVVTTRPAPGGRRPYSEHDPDWWEAVIEVGGVEKGSASAKQIIVKYPRSKDELWAEAPKFREGEEGAWLLQLDQTEKGSARLRTTGYTALHPLDFQPKEQLQRVQRLLRPAP
jgi:hypothetical protein